MAEETPVGSVWGSRPGDGTQRAFVVVEGLDAICCEILWLAHEMNVEGRRLACSRLYVVQNYERIA